MRKAGPWTQPRKTRSHDLPCVEHHDCGDILRRSAYSRQYRNRWALLSHLSGGLVDIAATLTQLSFTSSASDRQRISRLSCERCKHSHRSAEPASSRADSDRRPKRASAGVPLLREMEEPCALIPAVFAGSGSIGEYAPGLDENRATILAPDALSNPEHLKFALKGGLAASRLLCHLQCHRLAGHQHGGDHLPADSAFHDRRISPETDPPFRGCDRGRLPVRDGVADLHSASPRFDCRIHDSVRAVTALASWFMTPAPGCPTSECRSRSAFYLINLQEFAMQTSLSVARDRVVGVLLGLFMMWLVFDQLWGASGRCRDEKSIHLHLATAGSTSKRAGFRERDGRRSNAVMLFARRSTQISTRYELFADGVLFEFGPSRQEDLALRDHIRRWQPQLRHCFS